MAQPFRYPGKSHRCTCGQRHMLQVPLDHDLHAALHTMAETSSQTGTLSELVHNVLGSFVSGQDAPGVELPDPPSRRIEVKWDDLRSATKPELAKFARENGLAARGTKQEILKRILKAPQIEVIGKIGGKGGMPRTKKGKH